MEATWGFRRFGILILMACDAGMALKFLILISGMDVETT